MASPDGSERVSGHSLRATGAQGLATAGVDAWAIELLGRWGGDTARGDIREARLADASAMAKRVTESVPRGVLIHRILDERSGTASRPVCPAPGARDAMTVPAHPGADPGGPVGAAGAAQSTGLLLAAPWAAEVATAHAEAASVIQSATFVKNSVIGAAHRHIG